ncbi:MAG: hypothetical protein ACI3VN_07100 [Candidatus Onthomonas sp.]
MTAACRAGKSPPELENWSWGELLEWLEGREEERRQQLQALSIIAWRAARLTAGFLAGEPPEPVYELFPFWTEEEQKSLRLARYRRMMEGLAAGNEKKVKR